MGHHDIIDRTIRTGDAVIKVLEPSGGLIEWDGCDPGHTYFLVF
jgi:hypothetical protein